MALKMIEKLNFKASVLAEQIAETLMQAILDDTLKGGQQLIEADLQNMFGISRSPLREAFRDLEKAGLVEIIPRKGTFVKKVTREDVSEIYPVRAVLEGLAAKMAHSQMTDRELGIMKETLVTMQKAMKKKDTRTYWENHLIFHDTFINASRNTTLINILKILRMNSHRYRYSLEYYLDNFDQNMKDHQKIYECFCDKSIDSDKISKLVRSHIDNALEPFMNYLEKNNKIS